jgi:hypothetical protein
VQQIRAGKSPRERAAQLIQGTRVKDVAERKRLYKEEPQAFENSSDAMIRLALLVDGESRAVRKIIENQDELKRQAYGEIAAAKYAMRGASSYPDATFTLRLAFGQAKGYEEGGEEIPFQTTMAGLYERSAEHNNQPPYDLPHRWIEKKDRVNLNTPFDFVSTADIIGGNSGSPSINKDGEIVGIIFDGNIYSLVLDFIYTDAKARAISVHSRAITEALRNVYDAPELVNEILGERSRIPLKE